MVCNSSSKNTQNSMKADAGDRSTSQRSRTRKHWQGETQFKVATQHGEVGERLKPVHLKWTTLLKRVSHVRIVPSPPILQ
jgi:hypothetical protein